MSLRRVSCLSAWFLIGGALLVIISAGCYESIDPSTIACPPGLPECAGEDYDGDGVQNGEDDFPLDDACAERDALNCGACGDGCPTGHQCDGSGVCFDPCAGRECGDDGYGGDCGTCPSGQQCNGSGGCLDPCAGRLCGDDGYGGSCGTCPPGSACDGSGACLIDWVLLEGGTYQMGSEDGASDERPVHAVSLASFEIQRTEVTVSAYGSCVEASFCTVPDTGGSCNWGRSDRADHPVNCVDWSEARSYCSWAGGRLCSESEWEYAARSGGRDITYPWGDDSPSCDRAEYSGCSGGTVMVCSKPSGHSAQGVCDLAGNVWEWVEDDFHDTYSGAPSDGSAWVDNPRADGRVFRGGSWDHYAYYLRASDRSGGGPAGSGDNIGFRCCRSSH